MSTITISSNTYNGQIANIVFFPAQNPSNPITLGTGLLPYSYTANNPYGLYTLTLSNPNNIQCNVSIHALYTTIDNATMLFDVRGAGILHYKIGRAHV